MSSRVANRHLMTLSIYWRQARWETQLRKNVEHSIDTHQVLSQPHILNLQRHEVSPVFHARCNLCLRPPKAQVGSFKSCLSPMQFFCGP